MSKPITIRIDVMKIAKQHLYAGKNGAKYLNLAIFENRDGPDKYDNTHYVVQDIPKEARDGGERGAILGNAKIEIGGGRSGPADRNFRGQPEREHPTAEYERRRPSQRTDSERARNPQPAGRGEDEDLDF